MRARRLVLFSLLAMHLSQAQQPSAADERTTLTKVLERLDALEGQNRELVEEVRALRKQLSAVPSQATAPTVGAAVEGSDTNGATTIPDAMNGTASTEERLAVTESRVAEQAQTKVESSQKLPVTLDGTLLFNGFINSGAIGTYQTSAYGVLSGPARAGATARQTIVGLRFDGPALPGGGQVHGSLAMDFGSGSSEPGASWIRLRRGDVSLDWKNRSFSIRQDKPIISPYQPDSLAEVIIPPLSGAGNLWLWLPQARYEERLHLSQSTGLTGQLAFLQTDERYEDVPVEYAATLAAARPAYEGRIAFWHKWDDTHRLEFAPGFHISSSRILGTSIKSRIGSLDWRLTPWWKLEWTGTVYTGQNAAGLGSLGNGFTVLTDQSVRPVRNAGGWTQLSVPLTNRLKLNVFGGMENDRGRDLAGNPVARNLSYASNLMYHLGPNVLVSFEALRMQMRLLSGDHQDGNRYDLALAYLF